MKSQKKIYSKAAKLVKGAVERTIRTDANSTSCIVVYQPKAPAELKKFSKK